ncbi:hypothetical protein SPRG_13833 [Saprolegnia parasitica CBS 223.65]|uniref:Uncharacterized protein n=1 Tax=Saprolegnia parasitica (strain CBS 223.65) TaxID=695850 RepID=A0A067BS07_SAPPC|nr:hypothetical protein SPRG_13833 [Saprolegnia parasitica CBS 223.65]KDO21043.1 hypothetical protein SPRG_13833 [Saprolegnia parasitica CBS 223.65]|eukprot:XP_012208224.1 hypothetical protein SPRG_13833 [Saprolegnia parasitica CBS 223.65]
MRLSLLAVAAVSSVGAQASTACAATSCYAGAQFNSANKLTAAQAIGNLQAPCYEVQPQGVACYAYTTAGTCPFKGMSDCGTSTVVTTTPSITTSTVPTTPVASTTVAPGTPTLAPGTPTLAPGTPTSVPGTPTSAPNTPSGSSRRPSTPSTPSGSNTKGSASGSQNNTATNGAAVETSSSIGSWPYFVGGGAALLLIGVIVIVLIRKTRDGDDDDEVEDHIYQSQHRSGKHSMQSVSGTHVSPYDVKQTHSYDVETGYQPTIGYHDPRPQQYQPQGSGYAPQSPYRAKPAMVQASQMPPPPVVTNRDMHLLTTTTTTNHGSNRNNNYNVAPDDDRQSVTF